MAGLIRCARAPAPLGSLKIAVGARGAAVAGHQGRPRRAGHLAPTHHAHGIAQVVDAGIGAGADEGTGVTTMSST
jgi:hypothetical protein